MVNKAILVGYLGADPETLRTKGSGIDYARFDLATSEKWRDKATGERREKTQWHKVIVWSKPLFEVVRQYLKKGSHIYVEGVISTRKWTDKHGVDRWITEIELKAFGSKIVMLDRRAGEHAPEPEEPDGFGADDYRAAKDGEPVEHKELDDEIPF